MNDKQLENAGARIATALRTAGIACIDWGDGDILVEGWHPELDLRVDVWVRDEQVLADIISADVDGNYDYLVESMPVENLDYIVEQVKLVFDEA